MNAYVLTEKQALHMRAIRTFTDDFSLVRKNGEEWLIKMTDTETHIPGVYEQVNYLMGSTDSVPNNSSKTLKLRKRLIVKNLIDLDQLYILVYLGL